MEVEGVKPLLRFSDEKVLLVDEVLERFQRDDPEEARVVKSAGWAAVVVSVQHGFRITGYGSWLDVHWHWQVQFNRHAFFRGSLTRLSALAKPSHPHPVNCRQRRCCLSRPNQWSRASSRRPG